MGGCLPRKTISSTKKVSKSKDLIIEPGVFVRSNELRFGEVYEMGQSLGRGAFGEVREAKHRETKIMRAVKIFLKESDDAESKTKLLNEVNMLKGVDHPNVVRVFEYFDCARRSYIVMELCKGGELFDELARQKFFSEDDAALVVKQLFSAVAYLHSNRMIHRDLKPENILLENKGDIKNIKVSDFGTATLCSKDGKVKGALGTAYYIAPEVILGNYDSLCDMWSCGVIIYVLLCGCPPFDGRNDEEILGKVLKGNYSFNNPAWSGVSREAKDLISSLICPVQTRLTANAALAHPWIARRCANDTPSMNSVGTALTNLRTFHKASKLRDAVSIFITTQCISAEETKELRAVFRSLDTNGDGRLSKSELMAQYINFMGEEEAKDEVSRIMKEVDTDKSGYIDYTEFLKASLDKRKLLSAMNLRTAFNMFDKDHSGSISVRELRSILENGAKSSDKVWNEIMREIDANGDGEIDLKEFEGIVSSKL